MSRLPHPPPALVRRLLPALPVGLALLIFAWGINTIPFYTKGEPREGLVVWTMVETGNWILPLRNGTEIPSKPPLFHWLGALASLLCGAVTEATTRVPSVVLGVLGIALTYRAGRRAWGHRTGLMASLILATTFEWVRAASTARVDTTLTFFMTAALLLIWEIDRDRDRRNTLGPAVTVALLLALATLAKGPVGAILPALVVGSYALVRRDMGVARRLHPIVGLLVVVVVAGSWYGLAIWQGGERFVTKQILQETVLRFVATERGDRGHAHSPFYLIPALLGGMAPWSLFLPALALFLVRQRRRLADSDLLYPTIWFVTVFVFYSLSSGKRSVYLLPAYPAAALLLGRWWSWVTDHDPIPPSAGTLARAAGYGCAALFATVALLLALVAVEPGLLDSIRSVLSPRDAANVGLIHGIARNERPALALGVVVSASLAWLVSWTLRRHAWRSTFGGIAAALATLMLLVHALYLPVLADAHSYKPFMARVRDAVGTSRPLYFFRVFDYGVVYYARRNIPALLEQTPPDSAGPIFILMRRAEWNSLPPPVRAGLRVVDRSTGTGPKGDRPLVLVRAEGRAVARLARQGHVSDADLQQPRRTRSAPNPAPEANLR